MFCKQDEDTVEMKTKKKNEKGKKKVTKFSILIRFKINTCD